MKVTFKNTIQTLQVAFVCLLSVQFSIAQNGVRIAAATGTADASAMLDVVSTTKGFLAPRMTAAQRTAIVSPATGLIVYQTDGAQGLYYFTGPTGSPANTWVQLSAGALSGAGTTNYVAKWTSASAIGNSQIFDNGTGVGISSATPTTNMLLDVNGNMLARKYVVQDQVDGTNARGIWMWDEGDSNWGIYMAQSGAGKSLANGTAVSGGGFAAHAIRFRVNTASNQGFIFENNSEQNLLSIRGDNGRATFRGGVQFDCIGCGSTSTVDGDGSSNWGTLTVQGRVLSTNSNLHLSPASGFNVIINDDYRASGGVNTGTAGLQVESLAGTGTRPVYADASGILLTSNGRQYTSNGTLSANYTTGQQVMITTANFAVVAGELLKLDANIELRNVSGSGNDRWRVILQVSACGGAWTEVSRTITATPYNNHGTFNFYPYVDLWAATCTGNVQFRFLGERFDSDDSWNWRNIRILITKE